MQFAVISDVRGGNRQARIYRQLDSFILKIGQQLLIAKVRSLLEHQRVPLKKIGLNHHYYYPRLLVLVFDMEAIFQKFRLGYDTDISEMHCVIHYHWITTFA
jgi:hypothetical protein